jgi:hypothetical protein
MFGNIAGFMYILARGAAPSLSSSSTIFRWRRHVASGEIALGVLLAGMARGIAIGYITWHGFFIRGIQSKVALIMAPLIIFGLVSGVYINHMKKK